MSTPLIQSKPSAKVKSSGWTRQDSGCVPLQPPNAIATPAGSLFSPLLCVVLALLPDCDHEDFSLEDAFLVSVH